jgi:predicted regulator of Ras-like GTPase activity (Roadblock/LC7/MglB family)
LATTDESVSALLGENVRALLLATADGLVIDAATQPGTSYDFDNLAAEVAGIFRAANLIGRDVGASAVRSVALILENGQMVLAVPIAGEAIGVVIPLRAVSIGETPKNLDQIRTALHHIVEHQTGQKLVEALGRMDAFQPITARDASPINGVRGRIALKSVQASAVGNVATVRVNLGLGPREVTAKTVGRDESGQRALLAGQATIRAMLELLPPGHAVELTHLQATTPAREALWALTRFLSPDAEQSLFGIAPVQDENEAMAAAKAILNAVNRRIEVLLTASPS